MAKQPKRKTPKARTAAAPAPQPGPVAAQNVILERMESQLRVVAEGVMSTRDTLRQEMQGLKHELSTRMDTLEFVVRTNSTDLQTLTVKVDRLDAKLDANTGRTAALEQRVEALELPVG